LTLKSKIHSLLHNPSILKDIIQGKSINEIRINIKKENESQAAKLAEKEILDFISNLKQTSPYLLDPNDNPQINRLCYIEDWQNKEISDSYAQIW
jgi:hypothetical protein